MSVTGVTGARPGKAFSLNRQLNAVRKLTNTPVCAGFGVATPKQAASLAGITDGVIIGSALIEIIKQFRRDIPGKVGGFLKSVRIAIDAGRGKHAGNNG